MSMRIGFKSLARPRRAAKALCEHIPGTKLSEAQSVVARMCDYDGWVQLKHASEQPDAEASPDDEDLTAEALEARLEFQAQQVRAATRSSRPGKSFVLSVRRHAHQCAPHLSRRPTDPP
jgi:hypothetical protein